jgi:hypothetical protein
MNPSTLTDVWDLKLWIIEVIIFGYAISWLYMLLCISKNPRGFIKDLKSDTGFKIIAILLFIIAAPVFFVSHFIGDSLDMP